MGKFKVGDIVVGNDKANMYSVTKKGWVGQVTFVNEDNNVIWITGVGITNCPVSAFCFDLYKPNYKAVITSDGKTTTARYYENEKKVSEAKAVCHEEDEFDFNTGAVIALTRSVKGIDNVEVCIKDKVEESKETEWDKFKKDKISFVVYQKDIKSFLDACVSDNIKWRVNDKPADDVSEDKWKEWLSFPSIYFRTFPSQIGGGLIWGGFPNCNCSEWLKSFVRWNPSDPNHNPTKVKTYKGITIDGKVTTATLYNGKEKIKTAKSSCRPEDTFDFKTGAKIAFDNLIKEEPKVKPKELLKNGMFVLNHDNSWYIVVNDKFIGVDKHNGFNVLSDYDDDLYYGKDSSYGYEAIVEAQSISYAKDKYKHGDVVWKRTK